MTASPVFRAARDKASDPEDLDNGLKAGMNLKLSVMKGDGTWADLRLWNYINLQTEADRRRFAESMLASVESAVRDYNREQIVTDEIDVQGIAQQLATTPEKVADALARIRNSGRAHD